MTYPIAMPPKPEPTNCIEKASEGTARGQPKSWAIGLSATTMMNAPPEPISSSSVEAASTANR